MTLNDIGTIFGLTRMRICQIEKIAKQRISTSFKNNSKKIFE
jgi:DNA-directed RNA polymerase sigma subunit (sigma70/sigma32)